MRDAFLDLVAGGACVVCARPGRRLCPRCDAALRCSQGGVRPGSWPTGLLPVHAAGPYDGALRELVLAHKERSALGLVHPLGRCVADVVTSLHLAGPLPLLLVPVPSHPSVVRARGHDPVLRVVRRAARVLRARGRDTTVRRLLTVQGRPLDQAGLSAHQRRANLAGRFRARPARAGSPHRSDRTDDPGAADSLDAVLLVVDDVVTTGSTLREAQRALVAAGWRPDGAVTVAATRRRDAEVREPFV